MKRPSPWRLGPVALAAALALSPFALRAQDASVGDKVKDVVNRMSQAQEGQVWDLALELQELGPSAAHPMAQALDKAQGASRVALAKALLALEGGPEAQRGAAIQALRDVIRAESGAPELRMRACEVLSRWGSRTDVTPLKRDVDAVRDPLVKIALLKLLRQRGKDRQSEVTLREYLASEDPSIKIEAALALAEVGNVDAAKPILARIKDEPTARGRRAAALLEIEELLVKVEEYSGAAKEDVVKVLKKQSEDLQAEVEKLRAQLRSGLPAEGPSAGGASAPGGELFAELFKKIKEQYVDEAKTKEEDLIDNAASGMVDSLDPFSAYMSKKVLADFNEGINQQYGGIGAVVQMDRKTGYLTISRPIYGNPASDAGLRSLDKITAVEGTPTKGKTVQDMVKILKGEPGTTVNLSVEEFLTGKARELPLVRQQVLLKSVRWDLLPGGLGYVQLSQFGSFASREVEEALNDLERRGMKGLIFDLRGNPGGLLPAAVEIADKFLDDNKLVVYAQGRKGTRHEIKQEDGGPAVSHRRRQQPKHPDYPLVLLVDEHSASASEIVAGALQVHKRAELVGQRTFGKGSVQQVMPLESTKEEAALRITIAYYYLPDGRCIHAERDVEEWKFSERMQMEIARWLQEGQINEATAKELRDQYKGAPGGVEVDYRVENPEYPLEKQRVFGQIYDKGALEDYVRKHWMTHKETFHQLCVSDGFDAKRYPGFDELWKEVTEGLDEQSRANLTENDLRLLLRATIRRFAQDDLKRDLTSDFQEDRQLQAALMILAERTGVKLAELPELSFIPQRFPEGLSRVERPAGSDEKKEPGRGF